MNFRASDSELPILEGSDFTSAHLGDKRGERRRQSGGKKSKEDGLREIEEEKTERGRRRT